MLVSITVVDASKKCTHPQGNDGDQVTEGCLQRLCTGGVWRTSLASNICCYERRPYMISTTISSSMSKDGCVRADIECVEEAPGVANIILNMKNFCEQYATEEQVGNIKNILTQHMNTGVGCEQLDEEEANEEKEEAILVTGGLLMVSHTAELLTLNGTSFTTCSLPSTPSGGHYERIAHTQTGPLACGGWKTGCLTFSSGQWEDSNFSLLQYRNSHVAWKSPKGVLLMGGTLDASVNTTELLNKDGSSTEQFKLKYELRSSCAIELRSKVIITGGVRCSDKVSVYNLQGWQEDLPDLKEGRWNHGCAHYITSDNMMVYLVAGGTPSKHGVHWTDSTEILHHGESSWKTVGKLPYPSDGIRGITFKNKIIMTGGYYYHWNYGEQYSRRVQSFNTDTNEWEYVGSMKESRQDHGISIVPAGDFIPYCQ